MYKVCSLKGKKEEEEEEEGEEEDMGYERKIENT